MNEAVAFDVINLFIKNRQTDFFQLRRIHLTVAGHDSSTVDIIIQTPFITTGDCGPHAAVS